MSFLWVSLGGAIGSVLRYAIGLLLPKSPDLCSIPVSTLVVNGLGCLIIGGLFAVFPKENLDTNPAWLFGAIGILGGFTTFSTFGLDAFRLMREGSASNAILYVIATLILTLGCTALGFTIASKFTLLPG